jgi:hypothetical protein
MFAGHGAFRCRLSSVLTRDKRGLIFCEIIRDLLAFRSICCVKGRKTDVTNVKYYGNNGDRCRKIITPETTMFSEIIGRKKENTGRMNINKQ